MAALKHVVGEFYFRVDYDEETGKVEIDEYGLRSIIKGRAYFTAKAAFTWGKRSTKHGDFGWLPNIPAWARSAERIGSDYIKRYAKTKAQALRAAIAERRRYRKGCTLSDAIAECDAEIAALQARLKRTRT
ncbi:hypothetical protein EOB36_20500 [Mesorhizobium sp. M6A.T.Cr.TU.017.01.1.1]|uniref:hypothetical protein n=1 Tax=Mesorhizobium sp. M6A.T.Cr.TU.017.01.1.1 TaxID=2496774 RepID=UPI000FD3F572|nr:hypothetical protein [Mesorhizobium sp. M6A.T.Cr.TU.017.01.1.1]RUU99460.1 hypothetical protein EOB36_20500 [Mesorhizobium sp. M6A.T.Cr.TU.017.01.1.1]